MTDSPISPVNWVASSYKDFRAFPDPVQDAIGYALYQAQIGKKHPNAKPLRDLAGQGCWKLSPIMSAIRFGRSIRGEDTIRKFMHSKKFKVSRISRLQIVQK